MFQISKKLKILQRALAPLRVKWSRVAHSFMVQKMTDKWLVQGDAYNKYFHASLSKNHYTRMVYSKTTDEGRVLTHYDLVIHHFCNYYVGLFRTATSVLERVDPQVIVERGVPSTKQLLHMLTGVNVEETMEALWSISIEINPRPDGYGNGFFRAG